MYTLTTCVSYAVEFSATLLLLFEIFVSKRKIVTTVMVSLALHAVHLLIFLKADNLYLNIILYFIMNLAIILLCFESSWQMSVVISAVMTGLMVGSEFMAMILLSAIFKSDINAYLIDNHIYFLMVAISKTLLIIMCRAVTLISSVGKENSGRLKAPFYLFAYPVCTLAVFVIFWQIATENNLDKDTSYAMTGTAVALLASIIITYIFYDRSAKKELELRRLQLLLEKENTDKEYYDILDRQNRAMRAFAHDEKNHLIAIKSLADNPEVDEYIDKVYDDLKKYSAGGNTGNKMLDLIINKYTLLCEGAGVLLSASANTSNLNFIDNTDLTSMLSNVLDNAVEAARNSGERKIELTVNKVKGTHMLTCVNSCDDKPLSKGNELITTKKDKKFHGLGVKNIKRIAAKYSGEYKWSYDENKREFTTVIIFIKN